MKINNKLSHLPTLGFSILLAGLLIGCEKKANEDINVTEVDSKTISLESQVKPEKLENNSDEIVATVNGKPIYSSKLEEAVKRKLRKDEKFRSSGSNPKQIKIVQKIVLENLIMREALLQASLKEPVAGFDKKIQEERELIKKRFGSIENFKNYLPTKNMTDEQLATYLKEKVSIKEYLKNQGVTDPHIEEEKIKDFYSARKNNFKSEELVNVSHILLSVKPNDTPLVKSQIQEKANKLREMIVNGEDFTKVAKEYSQSAEANETGGVLGMIKKGFMPKEFDKVAFSMKVGELSQPVATKFGYHIIKVTDRQEEKISSYEEVRDFIRKFLQEKKRSEMMAALKQKIKQKAKVEIF